MSPLRPPTVGFPPSPLSGNGIVRGAVDAVTESPAERQKQALTGKYKGVAQWLKIIARTSKNEGIPPKFQAAITVTEHTGTNTSAPLNWRAWNTKARSPVGAQGIAQFMPGTWSGSWNPWRNKSPNDPGAALAAQARHLRDLLRQYNGDASKAAEAYNGGPGNVGSGETRQYAAQVRRAMKELEDDGVFGGGGIDLKLPGVDDLVPDPVKDAASALSQLVGLFLSPRKLGQLWANVIAYLLRFLIRSLWDYLFAPILHWHQRATGYYFREVMTGKAGTGFFYKSAAITTVSFWAAGYAILWARVDGDRALLTEAKNTPLGRFMRSSRNANARRRLVEPGKVKEKTRTKPEPHRSVTQIRQVGNLSVSRTRTVRVRRAGEAAQEGNENA